MAVRNYIPIRYDNTRLFFIVEFTTELTTALGANGDIALHVPSGAEWAKRGGVWVQTGRTFGADLLNQAQGLINGYVEEAIANMSAEANQLKANLLTSADEEITTLFQQKSDDSFTAFKNALDAELDGRLAGMVDQVTELIDRAIEQADINGMIQGQINQAIQEAIDNSTVLDEKILEKVDELAPGYIETNLSAALTAAKADLDAHTVAKEEELDAKLPVMLAEVQTFIDEQTTIIQESKIVWRGNYTSTVQYFKRDVVYYLGSAWIATATTIGTPPPTLPATTNSRWTIFVRQGDKGITDFATTEQVEAGIVADIAIAPYTYKIITDKLIRQAITDIEGYIDEVKEYPTSQHFPNPGQASKLYVAIDTNKVYRWSGTQYTEVSASIGSTDGLVEGTTNRYFTENRVRNTNLFGVVFTNKTDIVATDSLLAALGKLQAQIKDIPSVLNPMSKSVYDPQNVNADVFNASNMRTGTFDLARIPTIPMSKTSGIDTYVMAALADYATKTFVTNGLLGKADLEHTHEVADINDFNSAVETIVADYIADHGGGGGGGGIGVGPAPIRKQFAGDGVRTRFPLPEDGIAKAYLHVYVEQLYQSPDAYDYDLTNKELVFTEAPPAKDSSATYNIDVIITGSTLFMTDGIWATQEEAEAGLLDQKFMSPVRTRQAIAALGSNYATAAQGTKADNAVPKTTQITVSSEMEGGGALTGNVNIGLSTASKATLAKAETAVQPGALGRTATSNSYNDLDDRPTLGSAAAQDINSFASATQGAKADSAVQPTSLGDLAYKSQVGLSDLTAEVLNRANQTGQQEISTVNGLQAELNSKQAALGFVPINKAGDSGIGGLTTSQDFSVQKANPSIALFNETRSSDYNITAFMTASTDTGLAIRKGGTLKMLIDGGSSIGMTTNYQPVAVRYGSPWTQRSLWEAGWDVSYVLWRQYLDADGAYAFYSYDANTGNYIGWALRLFQNGNIATPGTLAKGAGTFLIDHPLDPYNKDLAHGFVEAPRYDLIYRGVVKLKKGKATVNIDAASNMTDGTFAALTTNAVVTSLNNLSGFDRVRSYPIDGGKFVIECETATSTDEISWVVIAERNDAFVRSDLDNNTDSEGRFVPERDKED